MNWKLLLVGGVLLGLGAFFGGYISYLDYRGDSLDRTPHCVDSEDRAGLLVVQNFSFVDSALVRDVLRIRRNGDVWETDEGLYFTVVIDGMGQRRTQELTLTDGEPIDRVQDETEVTP